MKPIISVISVLLSLGAAQAATIFSTTNINAASDGGNGYFGFATQLASSVMSSSTDGKEATLPATVYLNNLSLDMRNGGGGSGATFKVAVYTFTSDGTVGGLIGLSTNANTWADGVTLTFDFDNVALDATTTYQYLFVDETATWEALNLTAGTENMAAYKNHAVSAALSMSNNTSLPQGSGTYKNNTLNSWEGKYLPAVNFSTSNEVIPEPATATLGLLGLGVLLLRRRR